MGFKAILSCVEGKVGPGFAGRAYDERLLEDLPPGIDPVRRDTGSFIRSCTTGRVSRGPCR